MADDDEVVVSLVGDTSTPDVKIAGEAKTVPAGQGVNESFNDGDDPLVDLKSQFAKMNGRLESLQRTTETAVQQVADTSQRLQRAEHQQQVSQIDQVQAGIEATEQEASQAEEAYKAAFEAGDGAAMARAQRVMMRAEGNRARLIEAKETLQQQAQRRQAEPQKTNGRPSAAPADPIEAAIAGGQLSSKSAAWLRAHPECITDPKMNSRMMAAHNLALADDVAVDSEDYFRRIEEGIKPVKLQQQRQQEAAKPVNDGRRPSSGAASGSGASGGLNGGGIDVKLTPGEARSATDGTLVWNYDDPTGQKRWTKGDPIGLAEMARRKHEGKKAGLYDKSNYEA